MPSLTLADALLHLDTQRRSLVRDAALVLAGSMLVALCAKIQLPDWPVPITLQPFAVLLVGATLGMRRGGLAMVAYLLEGAVGLPVFAGPVAGVGYFAGPTSGYLFAFPIAAAVVGRLCERGMDRRVVTTALAMATGHAIILGMGFVWLSLFTGVGPAFTTGVLKFLPGDVFKVALAAAALPLAWRSVVSRKKRHDSQK